MSAAQESPGLTVRELLSRCATTALADLTVRAGATGLDRRIAQVSLQKTGLALTGLPHYLEDGRVLLFGRSEVQYLSGLEADERSLVVVGRDRHTEKLVYGTKASVLVVPAHAPAGREAP